MTSGQSIAALVGLGLLGAWAYSRQQQGAAPPTAPAPANGGSFLATSFNAQGQPITHLVANDRPQPPIFRALGQPLRLFSPLTGGTVGTAGASGQVGPAFLPDTGTGTADTGAVDGTLSSAGCG